MAEEPEEVLPQQCAAVGRVEDVGAELAVRLQGQQRGGQDREGQQDQAPCGVRKPATAMSEPKRYSQYANMFSRGNATSGAPICSGMIQFANPANSGVANISSMIVPCIVNA